MIEFRGQDDHGSGAYRAPRGRHVHRGADICCTQGDRIFSVSPGKVTKLGFPYAQGAPKMAWPIAAIKKYRAKKALRYVQVTDDHGVDVRYFYVNPAVRLGEIVLAGSLLGPAQGLSHIYSGIIEHYHFEVLVMVQGTKVFMDPEQYLRAVGAWQ